MNELAMITDLHFGIKKGADEFLQSQFRFLRDQFIPTLKSRGIKNLVFGGDLFEYRTHINVKIQNAVLELFQNDLADFNCYVLIGNHDIYYNTNIKTNSIKHLGLLPNVTVIDTISKVDFNGKKVLMVPWQTDDKNFVNYIQENVDIPDVCLCHYAIQGFLLNKSKVNDEGLSSDIFFNNFKLVISGHFHTRSLQSREGCHILYMGSPWHLSRIDVGEDKGGLILNLNTKEYEFVNNEKSLRFVSVTYPNLPKKEDIEGNIVDVFVTYDENYSDELIHAYIEKIENMNPVNPPTVKIINNFSVVDTTKIQVKNTYELMRDYIAALNIGNGEEIYKQMEELFNEARGDSI